MDELARTIEATCARLQVSLEHTAGHLAASPFAEFAAGIHSGGVSCDGITAPSHAAALCDLAAIALEAGQGFVRDNDPDINRAAVREINGALEQRLETTDGLGLLQTIGRGLRGEFTGAEASGIDVELLRLMMRSTYQNVEILMASLWTA